MLAFAVKVEVVDTSNAISVAVNDVFRDLILQQTSSKFSSGASII